MKINLKKIILNPVFISVCPVILILISYIYEFGYFESKAVDVHFIQIDIYKIIESLPILLLFVFSFIVIFSITEFILDVETLFGKKISKYEAKSKIYMILIFKLLLITIIYYVIGKSFLNLFEITKSNFIFVILGFFFIFTLIVFFWFSGNIFVKNLDTGKGMIWKCVRITNFLILTLLLFLTVYLIGFKEGKKTEIGYTTINNERFDVIRIYHDKILVGKKSQCNKYIEFAYLQGNEVIIKK